MIDQLPDIAGRVISTIQKRLDDKGPTHAKSNYASKLGHPCARFGVHSRVDWAEADPATVTREMIFAGGRAIEETIAKQYVEMAGLKILTTQENPAYRDRSRILDKLQIGCRLDFFVEDPITKTANNQTLRFPIEAKTMSPYAWEKINALEDLLESKALWHRLYPAQLAIQMFATDSELGLFLLIDKVTFRIKTIWVHLDFSFVEDLLKRAEVINKHIASGTYPDRIIYDEAICGHCDYARVCLKDIARKEAEILDEPELLAMLDRREELKPMTKEYDELDKEIKAKVKEKPKVVIGPYLLLGKSMQRKAYEVQASEYWVTNIKKL